MPDEAEMHNYSESLFIRFEINSKAGFIRLPFASTNSIVFVVQ